MIATAQNSGSWTIDSAGETSSQSALQDKPGVKGQEKALSEKRGVDDVNEPSKIEARQDANDPVLTPNPTALINNVPIHYQMKPNQTLAYSVHPISSPTITPQPRKDTQEFYDHDILRRDDEALPLAGQLGPDEEDKRVTHVGFSVDLTKRQTPPSRTVYISVNVCENPRFRNPQDKAHPPQLQILTNTTSGWASRVLTEGYLMYNITADYPVVVRVLSPVVDVEDESPWFYDIVASLDAPYHNVDSKTDVQLKLIDSDSHAALLITSGLSNWASAQADPSLSKLEHGPPLRIFANNINTTSLAGLRNSYCALNKFASGGPDSPHPAERGLTLAQPSNILEQQFYVPGLNGSSLYLGQIATINMTNGTYGLPNTIGGGGILFQTMNFTTKHDENCAVIYNLTFCNQVNYAVPSNPANFNTTELAALYDNKTQNLYKNFSYSMQQIPCNTTPSSQYSLAVTCDDCKAAYKAWLCAVTIPKCEDFSSNYKPALLNWDGAPSAQPAALPASTDVPSGALASVTVPESRTTSASEFRNDLPSASPQPSYIGPNYLMPRNLAQKPLPNASIPLINDQLQLNWVATNSSRNNDTIGVRVQPGPYMEVLPCADLCYDLVRMCPAALGFSCPDPGSWLESVNYGKRGVGKDGAYTCNAPGAVYYPNAAGKVAMGWWYMIGVGATCIMAAFS